MKGEIRDKKKVVDGQEAKEQRSLSSGAVDLIQKFDVTNLDRK